MKAENILWELVKNNHNLFPLFFLFYKYIYWVGGKSKVINYFDKANNFMVSIIPNVLYILYIGVTGETPLDA